MKKQIITIKPEEEFITLNVMLKLSGVISTGGQAKQFLKDNVVFVNDEMESRRGRKLYHEDEVKIGDQTYVIKVEI